LTFYTSTGPLAASRTLVIAERSPGRLLLAPLDFGRFSTTSSSACFAVAVGHQSVIRRPPYDRSATENLTDFSRMSSGKAAASMSSGTSPETSPPLINDPATAPAARFPSQTAGPTTRPRLCYLQGVLCADFTEGNSPVGPRHSCRTAKARCRTRISREKSYINIHR